MALLLCAATEMEVAPTVRWLQHQKFAPEIEVLITGVGLLSATYAITRAACSKRPQLMVQAGIAGCFDAAIPLATTAVILRETVGDLGVLEGHTFTSAFSMGFLKSSEAPYTNGMLQNPNVNVLQTAQQVLADAVTVNEISTNRDRISYYKNGLGATAESMEGAALHYVGLQQEIPFLQLRSFSNYVGERNKKAWKLPEAVAILNTTLQQLLPKLLTV